MAKPLMQVSSLPQDQQDKLKTWLSEHNMTLVDNDVWRWAPHYVVLNTQEGNDCLDWDPQREIWVRKGYEEQLSEPAH